MKKSIKRIIGLTLCIIMCLGVLTSCGTVPFKKAKNDAGEMAERMADKGYQSMVVSGDYVESETTSYFQVYGVKYGVVAYIVNLNNYYVDAGLFFFCNNRINAFRTYLEIVEYVEANSANADKEIIVRKAGKMVFLGTERVWQDATEGRIRDAILGGVATIAIVTVVIAAIVTLIIILIVIIVVTSVVKKAKKKKKAKLAAQNQIVVDAPAEEAVAEAPTEAPAEE